MIIAVIGSSEANEELVKLATKVGYELAQNGVMIVCGGLGGVMTAVCKGAKQAGGVTTVSYTHLTLPTNREV